MVEGLVEMGRQGAGTFPAVHQKPGRVKYVYIGFYRARHFLLCTREAAPSTILVHWLAPSEIDADIGILFMQELKPLGLLSDAKHFGHVFGVVVCSLFPHDPQHALRLYAANTLRRYRSLLEETHTAVLSQSRPSTALQGSIGASLTCGSANAFSTPGAALASYRCSWLSASHI